MKSQTIELLTITAELCGHRMSEAAARILAVDLEQYPDEAIARGLALLRRSHRGPLTGPAIIAAIEAQDGRPGAEEAWAMLPKDEYATAVLTEETLAAMGSAMPLYNDGDKVGARMAFKEAYERIVREARAAARPVIWRPSLGFDNLGRTGPIADAVRDGRLPVEQALAILSGEQGEQMLALAGKSPTLAITARPEAAETVSKLAAALKVPKQSP